MSGRLRSCDFLSPNYRKFAVNATEIVRFLIRTKFGFCLKKNDFFFKIAKGDKFAVEYVSNDINS